MSKEGFKYMMNSAFSVPLQPAPSYDHASVQRLPSQQKVNGIGESTRSRRKQTSAVRGETHIPRPCNAFLLFRKSYMKKKFPCEVKNQVLLSLETGEKWNSMSEAEKKPFKEMAETECQRHRLLYPDYKYRPRVKSSNKTGKNCYDGKANMEKVRVENTVDNKALPPCSVTSSKESDAISPVFKASPKQNARLDTGFETLPESERLNTGNTTFPQPRESGDSESHQKLSQRLSSSPSPIHTNPTCKRPRKKVVRNKLEKERRDKMKERFTQLKELLSLDDNVSRFKILDQSVKTIREFNRQKTDLARSSEALSPVALGHLSRVEEDPYDVSNIIPPIAPEEQYHNSPYCLPGNRYFPVNVHFRPESRESNIYNNSYPSFHGENSMYGALLNSGSQAMGSNMVTSCTNEGFQSNCHDSNQLETVRNPNGAIWSLPGFSHDKFPELLASIHYQRFPGIG